MGEFSDADGGRISQSECGAETGTDSDDIYEEYSYARPATPCMALVM